MVPSYELLRYVAAFLLAAVVVAASLAVLPAAAQSDGAAAVAVSNTTVSPETPTAGEPFSLEITVANYERSPTAATINEVVVVVDGERRYAASDVGRLTPGTRTTFDAPVTIDDPGQHTIRLEVYGESRGGLINTQSPVVVDVRPQQRPSLSVSVSDAVSGASRDVNVTVANGAGERIDGVVVRADSPADPVTFDETTRVAGEMSAGDTRTFTLPARAAEAGTYPVDLSLAYADDGERRTVTERFEARFADPTNPGRVILSGVETTRRGGTLELSATASNVGGTEVGGVVVAVDDTDVVRSQTYFVGSIEGNGFSTFSLQTDVTGDGSAVPVDVRYVSGGVERSFTTEVSVPPASRPATPNDGGGGSVFGTAVPVAAGAVVALVGGVVYRRRR
ncbi:MAG: hypothetical protein A07HB70_01164 [uncultured archaeon A07HB70]|nr:MAG: hypothetical protein A07HB70_01164 [uncultured archaeon A07HB70]